MICHCCGAEIEYTNGYFAHTINKSKPPRIVNFCKDCHKSGASEVVGKICWTYRDTKREGR